MIDLLRALGELLMRPLDRMPEGAALLVVSVVSGVVALYVVKWTTNQKKLSAARDQLTSAVLEIRLYLDSPRRVWKAQGRVAAWTGKYIVRALPALLLLVVPFTLVFMHMYVRHEVAPVSVGEDVLVKLEADAEAVTAAMPAGVEQTAPVFRGSGSTYYLRVRPSVAGRHEIVFDIDGVPVTKLVVAGAGRVSSPERGGGIHALWALGVEGGAPRTVARISVAHPSADRSWLGMPWWAFWLVVSTVAAFALRRPLGVVI